MNKNNSSLRRILSLSLYGVRLRLDPQGMIESRDENHRSAAKCLQVARRIVSKRYLRYSSLIFARFQPVFDSLATPTYEIIQHSYCARELVKRKLVKRRHDDRSIRESLGNRWRIDKNR